MSVDKFLYKIVPKEIWDKYTVQYTDIIPVSEKKHFYKISICTNCMDRTSDLKQTYEQNILDNIDYPNIEFVLLNYNSKDDMDEWAKSSLKSYIDCGVLKYYSTDEPKYYNMSDSRNRTNLLATGDIINNVDADQYTNKGFAFRINDIAHTINTQNIVFVKSKQKNRGRVGMFKQKFIELGGYADFQDYGYEDEDLILRAYHSGCIVVKFGGEFMRITEDHKRRNLNNYKEKDWRFTQRRNALISLLGLSMKRYKI